MIEKKTYTPAKPRNKRLLSSSKAGLSGISKSETSSVIGNTHEHKNKSILDRITDEMLAMAERELIDSLNTTDELTDDNILSSLRVLAEIKKQGKELFLSKVDDDTAGGLITFLKGLISKENAKLEKGAEFGEFSSGMFTGKGGRIDEKGNGELESLIIRSLLEVPEIRYNRLTLVGEEFCIGAGGIILEVTPQNDPDVFLLKMKLEEGEMIPFAKDDIVKGIFNQQGGFHTSWFRVDVVDQEAQTITVTMGADAAVPNNKNYPPKPFMNIARRGNFTDASRQTSLFLSAKDGNVRMLDGVDNYMAGVRGFQLGKPAGLEDVIDFSKLPINQNQGYLYVRGLLVQDILRVDYQGKPIKEIRDRGIWSLAIAQGEKPYRCTETVQDDVWVTGVGKFRCIVDNTAQKPEVGSTDWLFLDGSADLWNKINDLLGSGDLRLEIESSDGNIMVDNHYDSDLTAKVMIYLKDITASATKFLWTRQSGTDQVHLANDALWNDAHKDINSKTIHITQADITEEKVKFICDATVDDNIIKGSITV